MIRERTLLEGGAWKPKINRREMGIEEVMMVLPGNYGVDLFLMSLELILQQETYELY